MAGGYPRFKLYESDGTTLVYEFENVLNWGDSPFQDPESFAEHNSLRGQGSIISEGSSEPWNLPLQFYLPGDNYEDLVGQMSSLRSSIVFNTKYVLRIDINEVGGTEDLKVKRLSSILFPVTTDLKVVKHQIGNITFRVSAWA